MHAGKLVPSGKIAGPALGLLLALGSLCSTVQASPPLSASYPTPPYFISTWTPVDLVPTLAGANSATWTVVQGALPAGLSLNAATGEITGISSVPSPGASAEIQAAANGQTASTLVIFFVVPPLTAQFCDCYGSLSLTTGAVATNEVNAVNGEEESYFGILHERGLVGVDLTAHYSTNLAASGFSGSLGPNWMHNYETALSVSPGAAQVTLPGGQVARFLQLGSTWTLQAPSQIGYQLADVEGGFELLDPGSLLIATFSSSGALTGISDRNGNQVTVTPGPHGPTTVSDGFRTLTFTYNGAGALIEVTDQGGRQVSFGYTNGNLTSYTNADGAVSTYSYTSGGQMTATTEPAGNTPYTLTFNGQKQVATDTDSFGDETTLAYNSGASTTTVTDARSNASIVAGKDSVVTTGVTDALNHSTAIAHDSNFRVTSFTDRLGNQSKTTYLAPPGLAPPGYPASTTDALGNTTNYTYTDQVQGPFTYYNLTTASFADGTSVSFTYDAFGDVVSTTDQSGQVTSYTYNSRGQVLTATNPAGGVVTFTYNADATVATSMDPAGNLTTYSYDNLKRPIRETFADGTSTSATYDAMDRVLTVTDERGNATTVGYDANGNRTSITDPLSYRWVNAYDTNDRVKSTADPLGDTTTPAYDPVSSLQSVTDAAGEKYTFTYDVLNRPTSVADPAGFGPSFTYDLDGAVTAVADALSNTSTFVLDARERPIQAITPEGETYSRIFNAVGQVTSVTNPLLQVANFSYESRGLLTGIAIPLGISASLSYDKLGLFSGITDPNGNTWTVQNDSSGRPTRETDPLGRPATFSYNQRNWLTGVSTSIGSAQVTYDAAGNVTQIQYSDGTSRSYTYDDDNRLLTGNGMSLAYDAAGRLVSSNGLTIALDAVGRMLSVTYAPGKTVTYTYSARGLLTLVSDWAGGSIAFAYDNAARLISMTRSNGVTTQYGYDQDSQVASITETLSGQTMASTALERDAAGKVTSAARNVPQAPTLAPGVLGFSYDAAEQVSGDSYDALGRVTKDALATYTWDLASDLTAYNGANGTASMKYDGFGMLTSATAGGTTQSYVWNYALGLPSIATVQSGGVDQHYYIYSPGGALLWAIDPQIVGSNAAPATTPPPGNIHHWYHFDEMGTTLFLTNDAGQITDSYGVTPYGETATAVGSTPNPFVWLGEWGVMQEGATGLYYMRARYYDSTSARFLSPDPVVQLGPLQMNPYQYATDNPISNADPKGMQTMQPPPPPNQVSTTWAAIKGFGYGFFVEGPIVLLNAFSFGQSTTISAASNKITCANGGLGTAMKVTAGIGAGATYSAGALVVAEGAGVTSLTTLAKTPVSQLPALMIGGRTAACGAAAAVAASPAVQEEATTVAGAVEMQAAPTIAESAPMQSLFSQAHAVFNQIVANRPGGCVSMQGPCGVFEGSEFARIEEAVAKVFNLPPNWIWIDLSEDTGACTPAYVSPEVARLIRCICPGE
jgi:RHS repeat-associated protein